MTPDAALTTLCARVRAGDSDARDKLIRAAQDRLERLAHRMLAKFPNVHRWAETGDVYVNAVMRLLRALEAIPVADTREFFNLAAAQIRRELLDLARHFYGPNGVGKNHASHVPGGEGSPIPEPQAPNADQAELERWTALHEAVEQLPIEEREVFGLTFYHGWSQKQIAEQVGVDERTVRRRWRSAGKKLHEALGGQLPETEVDP